MSDNMNHQPTVPLLGFGTWPLRDTAATEAVQHAIDVGFRHIDTAQMYENEADVGKGWSESGVAREQLYLVTKVNRGIFGAPEFADSVARSLDALRTDYVNLLLIHWPPLQPADFESALDQLSACLERGQTRAIGVSNFNVPMLRAAHERTGGRIVTNQVEYHVLLDQTRLQQTAEELGMMLTAYCPLARGEVQTAPAVQSVANRTGYSPSQVALRWIVQNGVSAIAGSSSRVHIAANFAVGEFELSSEDMAELNTAIASNRRVVDIAGWSPDWNA